MFNLLTQRVTSVLWHCWLNVGKKAVKGVLLLTHMQFLFWMELNW